VTAEVKLRTLAAADPTLAGLLGSPFRWYEAQLMQGSALPAVTVQRISTARRYSHSGLGNISEIRFQFTIRDRSAETARQVAAAIIAFLGTADLASNAQFGSPVTTPRQFPNFVLNERAGMDPELQPPVFVEIIDARIFNREE
jgi:hypothetical protein